MSSAEEKNNTLARRFLEAQTKCDLAAMDEMMASDFVDLSLLPGQAPDREGYKRSVVENMAPFSDISITIDEQVAEGDKVTTWYTGTRTHDRGPYMGVAPTGRRNTFTRVVHHRIGFDPLSRFFLAFDEGIMDFLSNGSWISTRRVEYALT